MERPYLPWRADGHDCIVDGTGGHVGDLGWYEDRAAAIRAVNAHDALVEAARLTVAWWENPEYFNSERNMPEFVQAARAALVKAGVQNEA